MSYVPTSGKVELHLTYGCNLACRNCNRASFLQQPHTPDMTLDQVKEFFSQAKELGWFPAVLLIGGEPTRHPQFFEICAEARAFADLGRALGRGYPHGLTGLVQLWSNQHTQEIRDKCMEAKKRYNVSVVWDTAKPTGSQILSIRDIFVSPHDLGYGLRKPCWQHSSIICGISVDADGYSPCAIGGAVDALLGEGFRTKCLADLFDQEKVAEITARMCKHCGHAIQDSGLTGTVTPEDWRKRVDEQDKWKGMAVSPTWKKAFEGRK